MERSYAKGRFTREDLVDILEKKAGSYTPQWRFDREDPDLGTALAYVYASMEYDTIKDFERLPEKLKTEFFNTVHASMKPVSPARGYASFSLVNEEAEGTELPRGTVLTTSGTDERGEPVTAETEEDVFVAAGDIGGVFESWNKKDHISCLYDREEASGEKAGGFCVFSFDKRNLQSHELFIGCSSVFAIGQGGEVELSFYERSGQLASPEYIEILAGEEAVLEYSSQEGFVPFERRFAKDGILHVIKGSAQPPWQEMELSGIKTFWLRISFRAGGAVKIKDFSFRDVRAASSGSLLEPESIYAGGMDGGKGSYFPFREQFGIYDEVYFASREALNKRNAAVTLSFWREFVKVPLGYIEPEEVDWKLIMPKSAVKVEREYDITIDRVIWEYFNGSGWVRLFPGREYEDMFRGEDGAYRQKKTMTFLCPGDMSPALVNGMENYYIRARIIKVNNAFKTTGQYISPVLSETRFDYRYLGDGVRPEIFLEKNNMEEQVKKAGECLGKMYGFRPVQLSEDDHPALYIGFTRPLERGPAKLLVVTGGQGEKQPRLKWEYFGDGHFKEFHPADETRNFGQTGLITFNGFPDSQRKMLFGKELWWIRITDETDSVQGKSRREKPFIQAVYMNSVPILTIRSGFRESFTLEHMDDRPEFHLLNQSVYQAEIWVNETGKISKKEEEELKKEGRLKQIKSQDGRVEESWVLWKEAEDFFLDKEDRVYILDRNEGILRFSGSRERRLPAPGILNGIQAVYSTASGEAGNLPAGGVTGLEAAAGFINGVSNPLPLSGGSDRESADMAMERWGRQLKHKFRAVTPGDFEKLALAASSTICRAACFTGYGEKGERRPGHVSLVILQKDYKNTELYFQSLKSRMMEFMKDKLPANLAAGGRFHLVMPVFVEIQVTAEIIVDDFQQIFPCRRRVLETLEMFLDPVKGNFGQRGWQVGTLPERSQIDMALKNTEEVKEVKNLMITGFIRRGRERTEVNPEEMNHNPYVLPVGGEHRILVLSETG